MRGITSEYKGYIGEYQYIPEDRAYHGVVCGINSVVHFTAEKEENIEKEFRESVDVFLNFCMELGDEPEKPLINNYKAAANQ